MSRGPGGAAPGIHRAYHGGAFFEAIGTHLRTLGRRDAVVPADVLDAWFPPSPRALEAVRAHLDWLARTSPPTHCEGVVDLVAERWGVPRECVVPGAGSSDLIFRCLPRWVGRGGRALLLDPTYGEYRHVLERVVGCTVEGVDLGTHRGGSPFTVDPARDLPPERLAGVDLVVLVNPNSPTGQVVDREALVAWLDTLPAGPRVWVDETYLPYARHADAAQTSLAPLAAQREDLVVVTSLSKAWALSGMRAAHLVAGPRTAAEVRGVTPPWVLSLPTQLAVVEALDDEAYYRARWSETASLREALATDLAALGCTVVPGAVANFLLLELPKGVGADAAVDAARNEGVFLRSTRGMGPSLCGDRWLRTAVRSQAENARIVAALAASG